MQRLQRINVMKRIKLLGAVLALVFALTVFGAAAFEAAQYDHDCCGEGCGICAVLQICDNMLRLGAACGAALAVCAVCAVSALAIIRAYVGFEGRNTLISLRVRLDS